MSAIEETCRLAPDIVLLDVLLPDVSGLEVARRLAPCESTTVVLDLEPRRRTSRRRARRGRGGRVHPEEASLSGASLSRLLDR